MNLAAEGVIKFQLDFTCGPSVPEEIIAPLAKWRRIFGDFGWIGQDPARYQGLGFGNLSRRHGLYPGAFVISGTQTGGLKNPDANAYAQVTATDLERNLVVATGPVRPSSETLTHAAVYAACESIHYVFHVHAPLLWRSWRNLGMFPVGADVAYGTREMASAVAALVRDSTRPIVMLGHEDGLLAVGAGDDEAGWTLLAAEGRRRYPAAPALASTRTDPVGAMGEVDCHSAQSAPSGSNRS